MRGRRNKLDILYLAIFFGILLIAVIASLILFPEWHETPATLVLLVVAAVVAVVGFASNFRSAFMPDRKEAPPATLDYNSPQHRRNQENVAANVRTSYIDDVLRESLPERVRLELALDSPVGVLRRPMVLHEGREVRRPLASADDIAAIFRDSGRALLILGAPGSGKTVTLLELCKPLLLRAETDPREPVPVVLNLSTWAQKQGPLEEWIVEEMHRQYGLAKKITPLWLTHDHLCLLLDGLDEVWPDARDACVRAVNAFRETHSAALVVCSRSADYAELAERLALSRAVEIQPLDPAQVDDYLGDDRLGLSAVREAIRRDDALRELSTTPLMLNVMAVAYGGRPFAELMPLLDSETERRAHLYDRYIERVLARRPLPDAGYNASQALRWLRFIAGQLTQRNETQFFIEDLQPDWLPGQRGRWVGVLAGILIGILVGGLVGVLVGMSGGVLWGVLGGVLFGTLVGVSAAAGGIEPVDKLASDFNRRVFIEGVKDSLFNSVVMGGVFGFLSGSQFGVPVGMLAGVLFGVLWGIFSGLMNASVLYPLETKRRDRPYEGIRRSFLNALGGGAQSSLRAGVFMGLGFGSIFFITDGKLTSALYGVQFGVSFGILLGMISGVLNYGGAAVVKHYFLRLLLYFHRLLPLRLVPFLEAMRERILVQRAGAHYRFIHRTFQEHIAALTDERIEDLAR